MNLGYSHSHLAARGFLLHLNCCYFRPVMSVLWHYWEWIVCGSLTFGQVSRLGLSTTRWILIRGNEYIKEKSLFFSSYPSRRHTAFFCSCCRCPFSLCTHALISANGTVPRRGTTDFLDLLEPPQQGCVEPPFKREDAKKKDKGWDKTQEKHNKTEPWLAGYGWRGCGEPWQPSVTSRH